MNSVPIFCILCLACLVLFAGPRVSFAADIAARVQEGRASLTDEQFGKAEVVFDEVIRAIQKESASEAALVAMKAGDLFFEKRRYDQSFSFHKKSAMLFAKNADIAAGSRMILSLGDRYLQRRLIKKALSLYKLVVAGAPDDLLRSTAVKIGDATMKSRRYFRAIAGYRTFLHSHSDPTCEIHFCLAKAQLKFNRKTAALVNFTKVFMENPSSPWADEALYYAAMTLFFEKKAEKAKPLLEKMIHDYPKSKRLAKAKELLRGMP